MICMKIKIIDKMKVSRTSKQKDRLKDYKVILIRLRKNYSKHRMN